MALEDLEALVRMAWLPQAGAMASPGVAGGRRAAGALSAGGS